MKSARAVGAIAALVTIFLAWQSLALADEPPRRVVSINLCADQLLLALADPGQIASLSAFAADPTLSYLAAEAAAHRHDASSAESVIRQEPDLVLAGRFTRRATRELLKRLGYRVVELDIVDDIAAARTQIAEIAALLGHAERGEALIAEIDEALAGTETAVETRKSAAIYQRRGYVTGGSTLSAALLETVGLANAGGGLAGERGGFVPLERLVDAPPDYLVVASAAPQAEDQGSALLAHPALVELFPPDRRIVLPERLTVCAGPSVAPALRYLTDEVSRLSIDP
jgi:iron complex transport system substrate-binding protein